MPLLLSAVILSLATACAPSGADSADADTGDAGALSEAECRQVYEKSLELHGAPADAFQEAADAEIRACGENGSLSQEEYDCAMAASSVADIQACRIDIT